MQSFLPVPMAIHLIAWKSFLMFIQKKKQNGFT